MNHIWEVKMNRLDRNGNQVDSSTFSVAALNIKAACSKGLSQAKADSGFKGRWLVVAAVRGVWIVA